MVWLLLAFRVARMNRPLRKRLRYWLSKTQYDWLDWRDEWLQRKLGSKVVDFITEKVQYRFIEEPLSRLICCIYGHDPTIDHCGRPEHDYCACCQQLTPGQR